MAITEVVFGTEGFGFGAGDGDDEVVGGEVEAGEIELAEGAEEFTKGRGENLEPAGMDFGVVEPVNSLFAVLGGVDGGVGVHVMELEEDFFGAAGSGEPVAGEGDRAIGWLDGVAFFHLILFCSFSGEDGEDGAGEDAKVEPEGPVLDVIEVEGAAFFEADVAAAGDLGEAGEAGFDGEEKGAVAIMAELARDEGAGADEGDITFDDVEELGELVE